MENKPIIYFIDDTRYYLQLYYNIAIKCVMSEMNGFFIHIGFLEKKF